MKTVQMKRLWSREPCFFCGIEGLAVRAQDVPIDEPYVCEGCESYGKGYQDGLNHNQSEIQALRERIEAVAKQCDENPQFEGTFPVAGRFRALLKDPTPAAGGEG